MKKLLTLCLLLSASPVMAQENMTFGTQNNAQTYQVIKAPGKSVIVVNTPKSCNPPQEIIGKSITDIEGMKFNHAVRIIHPGEMISSDYDENRLDIQLDDNGIIQNLHCG